MSSGTKIEWTDTTWNPLAGCTPVSPGCKNCYAANHAQRLAGNPNPKVSGAYEGTARTVGDGRAVFTGRVNLLHDRLSEPLRWRKPRRVFVNAMSDLFHEDVPFDFVDQVFAVMAITPRHTYQVLTKRPGRMAQYLAARRDFIDPGAILGRDEPPAEDWPLPNVWLGTSVENQAAANERIPHLLRCPAAVRFLSCEPLLGPVDVTDLVVQDGRPGEWHVDALHCDAPGEDDDFAGATIHWVIAGGESGPGARPCNVAWLRSLRDQCAAAGVPFFLKQLGARPQDNVIRWIDPDGLKLGSIWDKKGGDMSEWPEDLRVREFPGEVARG